MVTQLQLTHIMASQIDQNKSSREELRRAARKRSRGSLNAGSSTITRRSELKRSRIETAVVVNKRKRRRSADNETKREDSKRKKFESLVVLGVSSVSVVVPSSSTACDVDKASRAIPPSS